MTRHLLIIGAQRCGTTYLHDRLAAHPRIAMATPARPEPKFFCSDDALRRGHQWYLDTWFAHAGDADVLGDKSTSYLECDGAAARAAQVLGDPLVLVQLRDPVARAVSNWRFSRDNAMEDRSAEQAFADCLDGVEPEWDRSRLSVSPYAYLRRGRYADQLSPWLELFPGRVRVEFLEEQADDPAAFRALLEWLGVDPVALPAGALEPVHASEEPWPTLDDGLVARLRGYFSQSDTMLAQMLDRALPWSEGGGR